MSREALILRLEQLEGQRRATESEGLLHELRVHQLELETQNQALREAQRELEISRNRYSDLYDLAPVPYLTLDRTAKILEANLTAAAVFGIERERLIGMPLVVLALDDPTTVFSHVNRCLESKVPTISELRLTTPSGLHEVRMVSAAVRDGSGKGEAVRSALIDIHVLKVTQRDLERARASEAELRRRLEHVGAAHIAITEAVATMVDSDIEDVLQVLVDQARVILGARYAAVGVGTDEGRPFAPWASSGVAPEVRQAIGRTPRPTGLLGEVARGRLPVRIRDLREHRGFSGFPPQHPSMTSFLGVPIRYAGKSVGTMYFADKVEGDEFTEDDEHSALMLVERVSVALEIAQLIGRERHRSELLEPTAAALAAKSDVQGTVDAISELAVPILGDACAVDLLDAKGALRVAAIHHRDASRQAELASLRETLSGLEDEVTHSVLVDDRAWKSAAAPPGGGTIETGSTLLVPLRRDGEVMGMLHLAFAGSTSDRRHADADVALAVEFAHRAALAIENARLHETTRRALASRDALLAYVSHDLGNVLNTMGFSVRVLSQLENKRDGGESRKPLDAIQQAVARMSSLVEALRDAAMIDAGKFTVAANPDQIGPLLAEACATFQPRADQKHLTLDLRIGDGLPWVPFDRERIHQVVGNLLSNAVEHTPEGGRVTVEASRGEGSGVRVAVSDTGPGIPPGDRPYLFERYWRRSTAMRRGTGLGLFIAKGIVESHGGGLWVESEVGRGTAFFFTLPGG
jgi:PAS domain S-box-containing protein